MYINPHKYSCVSQRYCCFLETLRFTLVHTQALKLALFSLPCVKYCPLTLIHFSQSNAKFNTPQRLYAKAIKTVEQVTKTRSCNPNCYGCLASHICQSSTKSWLVGWLDVVEFKYYRNYSHPQGMRFDSTQTAFDL